MASCSVDLPASLGPTTRFIAGPNRRSIPCRLPKPSISMRVSRMAHSIRSDWDSFVEGVEGKLERSPGRLFLLPRFALVIDQLSHHLAAAGELVGDAVEVVRNVRAIGKLEIGKAVAALHRERLRIQIQRAGALADERGADHPTREVLALAHRHHRVAYMVSTGHAGDVDLLLGE